MKVYYVRHGMTDWNKNGFAQGRADIPLCDEGKAQARTVRELIKDKHIDICIASPLMRTRETAEIVLEGRNVPILTDDRIIERDFGRYDGTDFTLKQTDLFRDKFWSVSFNMHLDDVEPVLSVKNRVYGFLDDIKEKYADKSVLLVAHGGLVPLVKAYLENREVKEDYRSDFIDNCGILEGEI